MGNAVTEACQNFNFNRKSGGSEIAIQAALKDEDKAEVGCIGEELKEVGRKAWTISIDCLKHLRLR